ncbi:hypothetical protein DQ384_39275 [Sphaerisporangium album]|uniref:Type VII secretion system protein EccE domain-containing protein n=1 Tax=Sphaerisporangium album TaxID=509200 RepID=A0A367EJG4_9ACTN|nr:SCO6880 family protein [Sphaerisporangium album]RCG18236.1 hypothetical protein DQ384_39275 [Sphaerisporangium album]
MSDTEQHQRYTFTFGPRETRGVVLGLGMGSVLLVFAALFALTRLASSGTGGLLAGIALVALTVAAVWVPIAERPLVHWIPVAITFALRRLLGYSRYRGGPAAPPAGSARSASPAAGGLDLAPLELPGELAGLGLLTAQVHTRHGPRSIGVVKDRRRGLYTLVISTRGSAFQLLTPEEQDARLMSWGETLAGLGGSATGIVRVQLLDTTVPDSGDALERHWQASGGQGSPATGESYRHLLAQARPITQRHDSYVSLTLSPRRARRQIRTLGGGDRGACAYLIQQAQAIQRELRNAGVQADGALAPRQLAMVIRTAYEPGARWMLERRGPDMHTTGGASADEAGPMACDADRWAYYRTEDTYHAVYWISEWPRRPVLGNFLEQLILGTRCERTLSVVMEPLDPRKAEDDVSRRETTKQTDAGMRHRWGFKATARQRRERLTVARQDEALASGHGLYRFLGLIRVSAPTLEALDQACGDVELNSRGLKLRRLYGEQDAAFAATLPLGRGLRYGPLQ